MPILELYTLIFFLLTFFIVLCSIVVHSIAMCSAKYSITCEISLIYRHCETLLGSSFACDFGLQSVLPLLRSSVETKTSTKAGHVSGDLNNPRDVVRNH